MSLLRLHFPDEPEPLRGDIDTLIRESEARIDAFFELHSSAPHRSFIPSDSAQVYSSLHYIVDRHLAPGRCFLEWGSGMGTATLIAASLGLEAAGIEIDPELVEASRALAADFGLQADFHLGDYLPPGYDLYHDAVGETVQLIHSPRDNPLYDELGLDMDAVDILFVYPWPGEAQMIEELFDASAAEGALLVLYQGTEDISLLRATDA